MSLYKQWESLVGGQTDQTFPEFWKRYSEAEQTVYGRILSRPETVISGSFSELAETFGVDPVLFMGFLDGIDSSLKVSQDFKNFTEESPVSLPVDYEVLFHNMLAAEAEHLYTLPQWDGVLTPDAREAIIAAYKRSKTVVKEKLPGRNDPCPCGSGKKYKKCCGASA